MNQSDFKRVPKTHPKYSQRWYINTKTGKTISRWDYQKLSKGGINPREHAKIRRNTRTANPKQLRINEMVHAYKIKTARKLGITPDKVRVRGKSDQAIEFRRLMRELKNLTDAEKEDNTASGKVFPTPVGMNR